MKKTKAPQRQDAGEKGGGGGADCLGEGNAGEVPDGPGTLGEKRRREKQESEEGGRGA